METWLTAFLAVLVGLSLLILGGELLVRAASRLAAAMDISPLVIGLTVVAFGTSSPELAVSVQSAMAGNVDIALGNVVGSNILNVLLILGVSSIIVPLVVSSQLIRRDVPIMVMASVLLLLLGLDQRITRFDGLFLVACLFGYVCWTVVQSRKESGEVQAEFAQALPQGTSRKRSVVVQFAPMLAGLLLLGFGSHLLVQGSVFMASQLGVGELVIGLTIVALGTSLPEVVTSLVAALRGERDLAVGNVVGSNIFNIFGVLGLACIAAPDGIVVAPAALHFDIPVMIAVAVACLPILLSGNLIARWEGGLLFAYYVAYTTYLVLAATQATIARTFGTIVVAYVIPLSAIPLIVGAMRALRNAKKHPG